MKLEKVSLVALISIMTVACNGGGGSSSQVGGIAYSSNFDPNPYPQAKEYPTPPVWAIPDLVRNSANYGAKIAYGDSDSEQVKRLTAQLNIGNQYICSAAPVYYDGKGTWLVTAAHCLVNDKTDENNLQSTELVSSKEILVETTINGEWNANNATAIFVPRDYCYGASFSSFAGCPNFTPDYDSGATGEGNDIGLIYAEGKVGSPEDYAKLAPQSEFPEAYTMAPILSVGNGITENNGSAGTTYYVTNYLYRKTDNEGYHLLYSSYFNDSPDNMGYTSLVCNGDSGGGDYYWNGSNWILIATHSFAPLGGCGKVYNYLPSGSTNVGYYYDWIKLIIDSKNPASTCNLSSSNCVYR